MNFHILNVNRTEIFSAVGIRSFIYKKLIQIVAWSGNRIIVFAVKNCKNVNSDSSIILADGIIYNTVLIQDKVYCLDTEGHFYHLKENTGSKECLWKLEKIIKLDDVVCFDGLRDGFVTVKRIHNNCHVLNCYSLNSNGGKMKRFSLELPPIVGSTRCVLTTAVTHHLVDVYNFNTEVILVSVGSILYVVHVENTNPTLLVLYRSAHEIIAIDYNKESVMILLLFGIIICIPWNRKHHYQTVCVPCFASSVVFVENTVFCTDGADLWRCTLKKSESNKTTISSDCLPVKGVTTLHYIEPLQCVILCSEYGDFYLINLCEKRQSIRSTKSISALASGKSNTLWDLLNDYCILWRNINLEISHEENKINSLSFSSVFEISVHTSSAVSIRNSKNHILHINIKNINKKDFVSTFWRMHVSLRLSNRQTIQNIVIPLNLKKNDCVSVLVPVDVYNFLTPSKLVCSLILDPFIFGVGTHCPLVICPHAVFYVDISYFLVPQDIDSPNACTQDNVTEKHYFVKFQDRFHLDFLWSLLTANINCSSALRKLFLSSKAEAIEFLAGSDSFKLSPHTDGMILKIIGKDIKLIHSIKDFFIAWLNQRSTKKISKIFFEKAWVILQDFDEDINDITYVKLQVEEWRKHITKWLTLKG